MWAVITNCYNGEHNTKPDVIAYFLEEYDAQDYAEYLKGMYYEATISYVLELHFIE